jgi:hypothetical protein
MTDLQLPPAPPLPADVRDRVLHTILDGIDDGIDEGSATARTAGTAAVRAGRARRRPAFLAAAAAVVVAVAASTVTALTGFGGDDPASLDRLPPAAADSGGSGPAARDPFAGVELPPPSGEPATDLALARCAAAVVHSGRAAEYPPTREWRATLHLGVGAVESDLVINDSFGCLVSPASVAVSGRTGTPAGPVQIVRMSRGQLLVLNPERRAFQIGPPGKMQMSKEQVLFVDIYGDETPAQMRLKVAGYDGPVPEPVQALTVVDRDLPERPDTPDGRELGSCLARLPTRVDADPRLWTPVGWHDVGGAAPRALVARIGDLAAGYCVFDPGEGPVFFGAPLPVGDTTEPIVFYRGAGRAILLAVAPDVTRVEVSSADGSLTAGCTVLDRLAMCTLDTRAVDPGPGVFTPMVVTAFTAATPAGMEVYRN